MKHLRTTLQSLLLAVLACRPVYAWKWDSNAPYFSYVWAGGQSVGEIAAGTLLPALPTQPAAASDPLLQKYPKAPGARCNMDQVSIIAKVFEVSVKYIAMAHPRHNKQRVGGVFTPNSAFANFMGPKNFKVLGAPADGPKTLFDALTLMFNNLKTKFATPLPAGERPYVYTCYKHYWRLENGVYKDVCLDALAFTSTYRTARRDATFVNFCESFFDLKSINEVIDDIIARSLQASIDHGQNSRELVMIHELMHVQGILWDRGKDIAYTAGQCRRLASYHNFLSSVRGNNEWSAITTPANADSKAMYVMSLGLDGTRLKNQFDKAPNVGRTSSAQPDPGVPLEMEQFYQNALLEFQPKWDALPWPPRGPTQLAPGAKRQKTGTGGSTLSGGPSGSGGGGGSAGGAGGGLVAGG